MQFKRHWGGQMGHTPIYRREDAACQWIEIDMLKLAVGQSFDYDEMDKEYALILLGGTGSVTGSSFACEEIGKRGDVFGGPATAVYVPRNRAFTVTAKTELTIAVCKSPAVKDFDPVLVKPEDVIVKDLGKPGWERQAHFIIDERLDANLLYIGEAFVEASGPAILRISTTRTICPPKEFWRKFIILNTTSPLGSGYSGYIQQMEILMRPTQ